MALPRLKPVKAQLSKKPSTAIRQALADLKVAERHPKVRVDMGLWLHSNGHCEVCLAGSVMLRRLRSRIPGRNGEVVVSPTLFFNSGSEDDASLADRLIALNSFRVGSVRAGLCGFGVENIHTLRRFSERIIPIYDQDRDGFYAAMYRLADDLAEHGL